MAQNRARGEKERGGSQIRAKEDEEGSLQGRGVGVRVPLARFSNAPGKKLQGTMNVRAMTHKRINAVYIASPTRKSIARAGGPHFESHFPLYGAKLLSNARSMPGGGGGLAALEFTGTTLVRA